MMVLRVMLSRGAVSAIVFTVPSKGGMLNWIRWVSPAEVVLACTIALLSEPAPAGRLVVTVKMFVVAAHGRAIKVNEANTDKQYLFIRQRNPGPLPSAGLCNQAGTEEPARASTASLALFSGYRDQKFQTFNEICRESRITEMKPVTRNEAECNRKKRRNGQWCCFPVPVKMPKY